MLKNLDTLCLSVVTELLVLLREEGHVSLPYTAQDLLGTQHKRRLLIMTSNREMDGSYVYLGIQRGLERIISLSVYNESDISILVHIDGIQVFTQQTDI